MIGNILDVGKLVGESSFTVFYFVTGLKLFADQDYGDKVDGDRDLFLLPRRQPESATALDTSPDDEADLLK